MNPSSSKNIRTQLLPQHIAESQHLDAVYKEPGDTYTDISGRRWNVVHAEPNTNTAVVVSADQNSARVVFQGNRENFGLNSLAKRKDAHLVASVIANDTESIMRNRHMYDTANYLEGVVQPLKDAYRDLQFVGFSLGGYRAKHFGSYYNVDQHVFNAHITPDNRFPETSASTTFHTNMDDPYDFKYRNEDETWFHPNDEHNLYAPLEGTMYDHPIFGRAEGISPAHSHHSFKFLDSEARSALDPTGNFIRGVTSGNSGNRFLETLKDNAKPIINQMLKAEDPTNFIVRLIRSGQYRAEDIKNIAVALGSKTSRAFAKAQKIVGSIPGVGTALSLIDKYAPELQMAQGGYELLHDDYLDSLMDIGTGVISLFAPEVGIPLSLLAGGLELFKDGFVPGTKKAAHAVDHAFDHGNQYIKDYIEKGEKEFRNEKQVMHRGLGRLYNKVTGEDASKVDDSPVWNAIGWLVGL